MASDKNDHNQTTSDDLANRIEDTVPPYSSIGEPNEQIADEVDLLLPPPGDEAASADDASTREELPVDTSADGEDDIIPLAAPAFGDHDAPIATDAFAAQTEPEVSNTLADTSASDRDVPHATESSAESVPDEAVAATADAAAENNSTSTTPPSAAAYGYPEDDPLPPPAANASSDAAASATGRLDALLAPLLNWTKPTAVRAALTLAVFLILVALLANSGTAGLVIGAAVAPVIILLRMAAEVQLQKREHVLQVLLLILGGGLVGSIVAWLGARTVRNSWFDTGTLSFGAAGYGGSFADAAGRAPFIVWLLNGILLPVLVIAAIAALPYGLRTILGLAPRERHGMLLSAAVASGYAFASASAFYQPLANNGAPSMDVQDWTLTIIGLSVIRPIVWVLGGSLIGAVVWRYLRTADPATVIIPGVIAVAIPLLFSLLGISVEPSGLWAEVILGIVIAGVTWYLYRRTLATALKTTETKE